MRKAIISVLICLCTVWIGWSLVPHFQDNAVQAWLLDVGQGESALVHEPGNKLLLFDGGPDDSVLSQLGGVLPPWWRHIDLLVLSHNHNDHISGLTAVLQRYQVDEVWTSDASYSTPEKALFDTLITEHHITKKVMYADFAHCKAVRACPAVIQFGQATLQVYHPLEPMTGQQPKDQHDATLSIRVTYASHSLFLTGDLQERHEATMLNECRQPWCSMKSDVLQVPHHGSGTGLSLPFLDAVRPSYAVIPVGSNNKFHHPSPKTLARLGTKGIATYRTDTNGRISIIITGQGVTVHPEHPG